MLPSSFTRAVNVYCLLLYAVKVPVHEEERKTFAI